jgi:hypothetical protein
MGDIVQRLPTDDTTFTMQNLAKSKAHKCQDSACCAQHVAVYRLMLDQILALQTPSLALH